MTIVNPNITRLAADPEPDLERGAGDGFTVTLTFTPSLEEPERAIVQVLAGQVVLDTLDLPAAEGLDAYRHTAPRSPALTAALT